MDPVILTMFDASYVRVGLVPNWLASLDRVGLRDRVVLYPLDVDAGDYAKSTGCEFVELWPDRPSDGPEVKLFSERDFGDMSFQKLEVVRHALSAGRTVLYCDPDIVFFRDPLPRLAREKAEILLQSDVRPGDRLSAPRFPWSRLVTRDRHHGSICAGFMCVRPTPATLRVFDRDRPDAKGERNDQSLLQNRIVWRREAEYTLLPEAEFPNGAWYAHERWRRGAAALDEAYMLHVNWCEGERKVELLRELGLWSPDLAGEAGDV